MTVVVSGRLYRGTFCSANSWPFVQMSTGNTLI